MKPGFVIDDRVSMPGRVRTAKEAAELLEGLRRAYRSLAPDERRDVQGFMSTLSESQRRFGLAVIVAQGCLSDRRMNG